VLEVLRKGCGLPFDPEGLEPAFVLPNSSLPDNDKSFVDAEIEPLLKKKVKERPKVVSRLWVVHFCGPALMES
jgi:hypothetical protein